MTLLQNSIVVAMGSNFIVSDRAGNIDGSGTGGYFVADTRFLSCFRVLVQGRQCIEVGVGQADHTSASFYTAAAGGRALAGSAISVIRDRYIAEGMHEDVCVTNDTMRRRSVRVTIEVGADFADLFEVRQGSVNKSGVISPRKRKSADISFVYKRGRFQRETQVSFSERPTVAKGRASFDVVLQPKEEWRTCVTVVPVIDQVAAPAPPCPNRKVGSQSGRSERPTIPEDRNDSPGANESPLEEPELEARGLGLGHSYPAAVSDLHSLTMEHTPGEKVLAAGLPWFMAVFGRDAIISAIQTKLLGPRLMTGTLATLAGLQATDENEFHESEPGKIPHEIRLGELSAMGEIPHSRYYGTIDATPLFVRLLWEAYQWTGDDGLLKTHLASAEAAIAWIDRYGDADGDGLVEYERRSSGGLRNQGWKDSVDSISFADGKLAKGSIALAEVQGYAYAAKSCMAAIYRKLGRPDDGERLEQEATALKRLFNEAYWMPEHGCYALALDGKKRQVDSITSNAGQCLWTGIVDKAKAADLVKRMMAPDMFSGWGVRTMSSEMARYNPLSYHNGSVWPHDNSLIASGMQRYGYGPDALRVARAMLEAAEGLPNSRLPELFAGFTRRWEPAPIPYPMANAPQAWASGAIIYFIETIMGISVVDDRIQMSGGFERTSRLHLRGVPFRGMRLNL